MTTTAARTARHHADQHDQARPDSQAASYLAAVAARLAAGGITTTVEPIGGIPVLTAEEPAADPGSGHGEHQPRNQSRGARGVHLHLDTRPRRQPGGHRRTIAAILAAIRTGQIGTAIRLAET